MSLTITANANQKIVPFGNDRAYYGFGAFTTTGTTVELAVPFKRIKAIVLTPIGAPAATEAQLSVNETVSNDVMAAPSTITVTRPAGTTSGLAFSFIVIGN